MPKRISKKPTDVNQAAFLMVERSTAQPDLLDEVSRVMAEMGRKGGKIGGKRRLETMTPDERSQVALKAAQARWKKKRKKSKRREPERSGSE